MPLNTSPDYFYFILNKDYDAPYYEYLPEEFRKKGTIFWASEEDIPAYEAKRFVEGRDDFVIILEDNRFCLNFETSYFDCLNIEKLKKHGEKHAFNL